ncbi:hypothetical protein CARUB_v10019202mg [Capsella rubella]|uniref:RNA helicase n=1 Tax=Capsella rubella TaxID=81985 RepID=R0HKS4_9BRAS|nr:hypothetical protein CARUB_v10019202mg [Capsella rubella]
MDPPAPETLMRVIVVWNYLGALDDEGNLTKTCEIMSDQFPLNPHMSKRCMFNFSPPLCISSMDLFCYKYHFFLCFIRPREAQKAADKAKAIFGHIDGDHLTLLNVVHLHPSNCLDHTLEWLIYNEYDLTRQK